MSNCASREHDPPVPATVHGTFTNPYNEHNNNADCWYCDRCASMVGALGFFSPDRPEPTHDPEGRALVQAIHARKNATD